MKIDIKIPSVGESVTEALLAQWFKKDGDTVSRDEPLFVIETDKVTLEVVAEADGVLAISVPEGQTVAIGSVVGSITATEAAAASAPAADGDETAPAAQPAEAPAAKAPSAEPSTEQGKAQDPNDSKPDDSKPDDIKVSTEAILSPAVRRMLQEYGLNAAAIPATGPGGRLTKGDVLLYREQQEAGQVQPVAPSQPTKSDAAPVAHTRSDDLTRRQPMSPIRRRIADRLLEARRNTAMLTTFNEIDMQRVMQIRSRYKADFQQKHDISLGFMSFFIRACVTALQEFPAINAFIDGQDVVYHDYCHIGIAIGAERGLVVPVIRHAEHLSLSELEKAIVTFVQQIKNNRLKLEDMEGGTFTITNGGVYGSLLSTPILNTPQSGILGMHKIEKRPVVVDDQIVIRPMMYVALSYDHRIVDGQGAVTFLKRVKECIEDPERMLLEI